MKLKPYLPALVVVILLTFTASSAFGIGNVGTVTGGTFRACVDPTLITTPIKIGGKQIAPGGLVRVPSGSTCDATETSLNLNSYIKTVLVSPGPNDQANGTSLRNAITIATPGTLVKVEPGTYDLGPTSLTLKQGVDLEGSGEGLTKITSQVGNAGFPPAGTVVISSGSEIRFVTIANTSSFKFNTGVYADGVDKTARLTNVTINLSSTTDTNFGIYNNGAAPTLKNSTISVSGAANNFGLYNDNSSPTIQNSTVSVTGVGNSTNNGIFSYTFSTVTVQNSTISASGGNTNYGIHSVTQSSATVQNSTISASEGSINNQGRTAKVGSSQLVGPIGGSGSTCAASYNVNYEALSLTCGPTS